MQKLPKNSVEETLLYPLIGRAYTQKIDPWGFLPDRSEEVLQQVQYNHKYHDLGLLARYIYGFTQAIFQGTAKTFLAAYPEASVVALGCGLDDKTTQLQESQGHFYYVDLPEVMEVRKALMPPKENETYITGDLSQDDWLEHIAFDPEKGILFVASGVLYYLQPADVQKLFDNLAQGFPRARFLFDVETEKGIQMSNKLMRKRGNTGATMHFFCDHPEKDLPRMCDAIRAVRRLHPIRDYVSQGCMRTQLFAQLIDHSPLTFLEVIFADRKEGSS